MPIRLAIIGDYAPEYEPHAATNAAIRHSCAALGFDVESTWLPTTEVDEALFHRYRAICVAPGSPYRDMGKVLSAIRYARERRVPCLAACGGFLHMVLDYARNVLGYQDAQHAEYDPYASNLFISRLACSLVGREMDLSFVEGSRIAQAYGARHAKEKYYCNFGVHPARIAVLGSGELRIVASDREGEVRAIELPEHPFFVGTLYVPQMRSAFGAPHPLVNAFLLEASKIVDKLS